MDVTSVSAQFQKSVASAQAVLNRGSASGDAGASGPAGGAAATGGFADALGSALKEVSNTQQQANELQHQFQLENPNVGIEDTMIAMNKASISFQGAVQVRNKLVTAYEQIMQMQV